MKTFTIFIFTLISMGVPTKANPNDFQIIEFMKGVESHGGGMTIEEKSDLKFWVENDYHNNRHLEVWLAKQGLDKALRTDIIDVLIDQIPQLGWYNKTLDNFFIFNHLSKDDFNLNSTEKIRELMRDYLQTKRPIDFNSQKHLLLASIAGIPEAVEVAKMWAPTEDKILGISRFEFPSIVVLARSGDSIRAAQAIACMEDGKLKFQRYSWNFLPYTQSKDVFLYLRKVLETEQAPVITDPDVVHFFGSAALNSLANMVDGLREYLAPKRFALILDSQENIQKALKWIDSKDSLIFR